MCWLTCNSRGPSQSPPTRHLLLGAFQVGIAQSLPALETGPGAKSQSGAADNDGFYNGYMLRIAAAFVMIRMG